MRCIIIVYAQNFHITKLKRTKWNFPTDKESLIQNDLYNLHIIVGLAVPPNALELTRALKCLIRNTYGFHVFKQKSLIFLLIYRRRVSVLI